MSADDHEARRFAAEHGHYDDDIPFWRAHARRLGGPVLDLGAATGRVAIPLARDGHEVWALDRSPAMLAELRRRLTREPADVAARVHPVLGELADPALDGGFRLVICAMNTLQVLTEAADRLRALRAAHALLAPGGELIFDVALPDAGEIQETLGLERDGGRHLDPESGDLLIHSAWYDRWEPETSTLEFTLRVRSRDRSGVAHEALRRHRVHLFTPHELSDLLANTGFVHLEAAGGFGGEPMRASSERQVHRARRGP